MVLELLYAAVSIQKLILFIIENFECVFIKSTFETGGKDSSKKKLDQSPYPGTQTYKIAYFTDWTYNINNIFKLNNFNRTRKAFFFFVKIVIFYSKSDHLVNFDFFCKSRYSQCVLLQQLKIYPFFLLKTPTAGTKYFTIWHLRRWSHWNRRTYLHIVQALYTTKQIFFTCFYIKNMTQKISPSKFRKYHLYFYHLYEN